MYLCTYVLNGYRHSQNGPSRPLKSGRGRILYAPRMPADPFARSVFTRSSYSRSVLCQRHANAHSLSGTPPPKTPPPGTPTPPPSPPTPPPRFYAPRGGGGKGPFGPLGPLRGPGGTAYTQRKLFRMEFIQWGRNCTNNSKI